MLRREADFGARLRGVLTAWVDVAEPYHAFAAKFFKVAAEPSSPLSPFSPESSPSRDAAVGLLRETLEGSTAKVDPSAAQVTALSTATVAALTTAQVSQGLTTAQVAVLSSAQVAALSATQAKVLTTDEMSALTTANVVGLSTAAVAALSSDQVAALSTAAFGKLGSAQIGALSRDFGQVSAGFGSGPSGLELAGIIRYRRHLDQGADAAQEKQPVESGPAHDTPPPTRS